MNTIYFNSLHGGSQPAPFWSSSLAQLQWISQTLSGFESIFSVASFLQNLKKEKGFHYMIPSFLEVQQDVQHQSTDQVTKPRLFPLLNVLFLNSVPSSLPTGAAVADNVFWFHRLRDQLQDKTPVTERNKKLETSLAQTGFCNTALKQSLHFG